MLHVRLQAMNSPPSLQTLRLLLLFLAAAGTGAQQSDTNQGDMLHNQSLGLRIGIIIGMLSVMVCLAFLLLMYAKLRCTSSPILLPSAPDPRNAAGEGIRGETGRLSGVDKAVIESLPVFQFSSLKGSRDGLECSVCLSRFVENDDLRLLPRCKHAFHVDCIDRWLDSQSTCPLCRSRVDADDIAFFKFSLSSHRLFHFDASGRLASASTADHAGDSGLELYIEREHAAGDGSSARILAADNKENRPWPAASLHNLKHQIGVSDVVLRSRWSDFNSADLMRLETEMLRMMSSRRFPATASGPEWPEKAAGDGVSSIGQVLQIQNPAGVNFPTEEYSSTDHECSAGDRTALISNRSLSDITAATRYRSAGINRAEEKVRLLSLQIPCRAVDWVAGKQTTFVQSSRVPSENV
ncbi:Putative RING-H2 finger protein ATL12 [Apostasia shenzhenica]|uniref:RING-type E3 ubiquitin transferase n=1 Tax=Apostasia shenzhenica TaxID=1088818 RepID=A0A2H9ZZM1_9ASPA|nr:Putative RING-H2 finger protein ATL12 [Apostasia shenzhenica]